jgi:hypothetical protein
MALIKEMRAYVDEVDREYSEENWSMREKTCVNYKSKLLKH